MKIVLPNLVKLSKNQVDANSPSLVWASEAAKAPPSDTLVEPPNSVSFVVL
jgi:hypothetical protein